MLSRIKAAIGTAWLYVVAVLVVLLALAGRRNASLREEIARRESARLQAQAERSRQAAAAAQQERARVEKDISAKKRDYFE